MNVINVCRCKPPGGLYISKYGHGEVKITSWSTKPTKQWRHSPPLSECHSKETYIRAYILEHREQFVCPFFFFPLYLSCEILYCQLVFTSITDQQNFKISLRKSIDLLYHEGANYFITAKERQAPAWGFWSKGQQVIKKWNSYGNKLHLRGSAKSTQIHQGGKKKVSRTKKVYIREINVDVILYSWLL